MKTHRQINCPKCTTVLEVLLDATGVTCPTCEKTFRLSVKPKVGGPVTSLSNPLTTTKRPEVTENLSAKQILPAVPNTTLAPLGLISYIWKYYTSTRWPLWLWIPLSIIVCAAASYFKPTLGVDNLKSVVIAVAGIATIAFIGFCLRRVIEYAFHNRRYVPDRPRSPLAKLAFGNFVLGLFLALLTVAEIYFPPQGITASIIALASQASEKLAIVTSKDGEDHEGDFEEPLVQTSPQEVKKNSEGENSVSSNSIENVNSADLGNVASRVSKQEDNIVILGELAPASQIVSSAGTARNDEKTASNLDEPSVQTSPQETKVNSEGQNSVSSNSIDNVNSANRVDVASSVPRQKDITANRSELTPASQTVRPVDDESPVITPFQLSDRTSTLVSDNGHSQKVVAEGVGITADEAVKDAFRNAVRQVVGAVVDAETLVKNDDIIDDKVLTYSDGFIKGYEEVPRSKTLQSGLHRIKIMAQVERRSVIAKLNAANVNMKAIDGEGLFAEAVTQLDAEKDAATMLLKQFVGFPQSCITATVIGKPEIVEKSADMATIKITVQIEPDLKAFKAFSGKLVPILEKLAKEKGAFTVKYKKRPESGFGELIATSPTDDRFVGTYFEWVPKLFQDIDQQRWREDRVSIAIATNRTRTADSIDYKYYTLDPSLEKVLKELLLREGQGKLQLLDTEGESVVTDRFELREPSSNGTEDFYSSLVASVGAYPEGGYTRLTAQECKGLPRAKPVFLSISSVFGNMEKQKTKFTISRSLTLSLDELKSVKDLKVEITFDD